MRRLSPLLLLAILVILAGVGAVYYVQQREARRTAPATPTPLPPEISSSASNWTWSKQVNQRTVVQLSAKSFKALKSPSRLYLEDVEVRVSSPDGSTFDRFKTASAEFNNDQATLYADGEVEITTGEPVSGKPSSRLVSIRTSGLTYDSKTNTASTDRAANFRFSQGEGRSVGVRYDPASREMVMRSEAEVTWEGRGPRSQPMRVEAGEMQYKERDSVILLNQWSRLSRGDLTMNAGPSTVRIENGTIRRIQTLQDRRGLSQDLHVYAELFHHGDPLFRVRGLGREVALDAHEVLHGSELLFHFSQYDVARKIDDHVNLQFAGKNDSRRS